MYTDRLHYYARHNREKNDHKNQWLATKLIVRILMYPFIEFESRSNQGKAHFSFSILINYSVRNVCSRLRLLPKWKTMLSIIDIYLIVNENFMSFWLT